ncbi:MAG: riboflavin synthase [Bacteroidota bacterium]
MFTGIIEAMGTVTDLRTSGTNVEIRIKTALDEPIRVDQSIAHNGVCLTVTEIFENVPDGAKHYAMVAVDETLKKTNLGKWEVGTAVNIERCLKVGARLDGHFVQGHVDTVGTVEEVKEVDGSWMFHFRYPESFSKLMVQKGSVCINGVSLTVVDAETGRFSVTIIPFTYEHTNFCHLKAGDPVNLEFDILGKYLVNIYGDKG